MDRVDERIMPDRMTIMTVAIGLSVVPILMERSPWFQQIWRRLNWEGTRKGQLKVQAVVQVIFWALIVLGVGEVIIRSYNQLGIPKDLTEADKTLTGFVMAFVGLIGLITVTRKG